VGIIGHRKHFSPQNIAQFSPNVLVIVSDIDRGKEGDLFRVQKTQECAIQILIGL